MFNLTNFAQALEGVERMIEYAASVKKKAFPSSKDAAKDAYEVFFFEKTEKYRLAGLVFDDGQVGLGRFVNRYAVSKKGSDCFEMSKKSLLQFADLKTFLTFLKNIFDATVVSYGKKKKFSPILFYILNKILNFSQEQRDEYFKKGYPAYLAMLRQGVDFANNGTDYLHNEPTDFTKLVKITPYFCDELADMVEFFKKHLKPFGISFYVGDCVDFEEELAPEIVPETRKRITVKVAEVPSKRIKKVVNDAIANAKLHQSQDSEDDGDFGFPK